MRLPLPVCLWPCSRLKEASTKRIPEDEEMWREFSSFTLFRSPSKTLACYAFSITAIIIRIIISRSNLVLSRRLLLPLCWREKLSAIRPGNDDGSGIRLNGNKIFLECDLPFCLLCFRDWLWAHTGTKARDTLLCVVLKPSAPLPYESISHLTCAFKFYIPSRA